MLSTSLGPFDLRFTVYETHVTYHLHPGCSCRDTPKQRMWDCCDVCFKLHALYSTTHIYFSTINEHRIYNASFKWIYYI